MIKDEVEAMDQGLFDKSGRHLSPRKSVDHDFISGIINKINVLDWDFAEHIEGLGPQAIYQQTLI